MNNNQDQDGFDKHYDVILTGTDFISSLLSSSLSRIGKKVLNVDCNRYYGKEWRSMKFSDLLLWKIEQRFINDELSEPSTTKENLLSDNEQFLSMKRFNRFRNVEIDLTFFQNNTNQYQKFFEHLFKTKCTNEFLNEFINDLMKNIENVTTTMNDGIDLLEKFKDKHPIMNRLDNMFIFDLCPKLLYSNEKLVKLLIDSTVTKYIEFKKISRLLTVMTISNNNDNNNDNDNDDEEMKLKIVEVPCTRSDIFMSNIISPIEKRYLMYFLEKCYRIERHNDWYCEYATKPFNEFLKTQTLTNKLQEFIFNTLLMKSNNEIKTEIALNKINFFLRSFGRFCDRPFLFPLYGSEDIIQAFCRYGAVWSGLYCLGVSINGIIIDNSENVCKKVLVNQSSIECDYLITDYQINNNQNYNNQNNKILSRAIILNTKSIKSIDPDNELGDLSFIHLSPKFTGIDTSAYCFETDYSSRLCPKNFFIQHFWCINKSTKTSKQLLESIVKKLCNLDDESSTSNDLPFELRNKILLSIYFDVMIPCCNTTTDINNLYKNIKQINTMSMIDDDDDYELNYEWACNETEKIFHQLYPDEEFFPITEQQQNDQQQQHDVDF